MPRRPRDPSRRPLSAATLLLVLSAAAAAPGTGGAQARDSAPVVEVPATAPAGGRTDHPLVAAAKQAQRGFERARRLGLRFYNGGAEARCEERIGRLCYWNNNGDVPPPEERTEVATEREELLGALARAAGADPNDDWTAGQRVRYLAESRRLDEATTAAGECRGTPWWCSALRGLVLHQQGRHAPAALAFDSALAGMPARERCTWRDVSLWLEPRDVDAYRQLACDGTPDDPRGRWEARFWRLAQPLWLLPGNDLRTELLARRAMTRVQQQGGSPYDMAWGEDMAESELRYGVPTSWSVTTGGAQDPRPPSVIGHEPTPSYDFVPSAAAWAAPTAAAASAWELGDARARMRYAPRYTPRGFVTLEHQLARFRRGDSALLVGAWNVERDRDWGSGSVTAGLTLVDSAGVPRTVRQEEQPRRGALLTSAPAAPRLMGLEVLGATQGRAARARYAVTPLAADAPLSDLLLLRRGAGPTARLEEVLPEALGAPVVRGGGTVGLYWESYLPASPGAPVTVSLTATRLNTRWLDRTRSALRIGAKVRPVAVRFTDVGRPDGLPGRSLTLNWPEVPAGEYQVELTVTPASGVPATTGLVVRVEQGR